MRHARAKGPSATLVGRRLAASIRSSWLQATLRSQYGEAAGKGLHRYFDATWYTMQAGSLGVRRGQALHHYMTSGWKLGLSPSPYFAPDWYASTHSHLIDAEVEPLTHYISVGIEKSLSPSPYFDCRWYVTQAGASVAHGGDPLHDYVEVGWHRGLNPSPYLDVDWYLATYPDVRDAGVEPLGHYLSDGYREGRAPNRFFDSEWYLDRNPDVQNAGIEPLRHYIEAGAAELRDPGPGFNTAAYVASHPEVAAAGINPLRHFLELDRYISSAGVLALGPTPGALEPTPGAPSLAVDTEPAIAGAYIAQVLATPSQGTETGVPFRGYPPVEHSVRAIAFYLPQFHPIPENDRWWGRGFTEWTNVARSVPQYVGHAQPRLPADLGYYDLRLPSVQRDQIEMARNYGVGGFCFHYYWFGGRRLLEQPLELFISEQTNDFPFCISWANENWTRRWDGRDEDILISQPADPGSDARFADSVVDLLRDERYIRVGDAPLLLVYRPSLLPDAKATVARWRQTFLDAGIGDVFLACAQFDTNDPRPFGFDAAVEFPPHKLGRGLPHIQAELDLVNPGFDGVVHRYEDLIAAARKVGVEPYDLVRGVMPGWDNSARRSGQGTTYEGSTPASYHDWLVMAGQYALRNPVKGESMVFVNAWNEWAEAAYLEPDRANGFAYLEATKGALTEIDQTGPRSPQRLLLVVHDAHNHGAQLNTLHIARTLRDAFDVQLDIILLDGGELQKEFRACGTVHEFGSIKDDSAARERILGTLRSEGVSQVFCNTVVSASILASLHGHGFQVVALVHELPGLIAWYGLESEAGDIARYADTVVFANSYVQTGFESVVGDIRGRVVVRPQGLYRQPDSWRVTAASRRAARKRLDIPRTSEVVLTVGFADLRKGIDLFMRVFHSVRRTRPDAMFVWLGCEDKEQVEWFSREAEALGYADSLRLLPRVRDVTPYYRAASVLLLPSREDPFPSVVLEALSHQVPVVAFEGATGSEELLKDAAGILVPLLDTESMANATNHLLEDKRERTRIGARGQSVIRDQYDWREYVAFLLGLAGYDRPTVSVVVPNYNYERYLRQRLESIRDQTYPIKEVIVLDDASTDDSLDSLRRLRDELELPFSLIANRTNSGSVSSQWAKGVEAATGDLVWIAEADDYAEASFLSRVVPWFDGDDVVMAYSESRQVDARGSIMAEHYRDYVRDVDSRKWITSWSRSGVAEIADSLSIKNTIPSVSAVLFKRERLQGVLSEEMDWISRYATAGDWAAYVACLLRGGDIAFVAEPLNNHRRHEKGVTRKSFGGKITHEIQGMQSDIRDRVTVTDKDVRKAESYIAELEHQFGLNGSTSSKKLRVKVPVAKS